MFVSCCEAKEDLDLLQYWYGRAYPWDAVGVRLTSVAERRNRLVYFRFMFEQGTGSNVFSHFGRVCGCD